jgi:hypothetical protein
VKIGLAELARTHKQRFKATMVLLEWSKTWECTLLRACPKLPNTHKIVSGGVSEVSEPAKELQFFGGGRTLSWQYGIAKMVII